jgi:hypothetical protein
VRSLQAKLKGQAAGEETHAVHTKTLLPAAVLSQLVSFVGNIFRVCVCFPSARKTVT